MRSAGIARACIADGRDRCRPTSSSVLRRSSSGARAREPVAFITGHREFWGLDFDVSPDVLVPRPETELIVEAVCERRRDRATYARSSTSAPAAGASRCRWRASSPRRASSPPTSRRQRSVVAGDNAATHRSMDEYVRLRRLARAGAGPVDVIVSNPAVCRRPTSRCRSTSSGSSRPSRSIGRDGLDARRAADRRRARGSRPTGSSSMEFGFGQDDRARLALEAGWRDETQRRPAGHPARRV